MIIKGIGPLNNFGKCSMCSFAVFSLMQNPVTCKPQYNGKWTKVIIIMVKSPSMISKLGKINILIHILNKLWKLFLL